MDKEKFLEDFNSNLRAWDIINYSLKQADWFDYNELTKFSVNKAIKRHSNIKKYKGHPSSTYQTIKYFIKIGFLLADPKKGLKVNPDFKPRNQ